MFHPYVNLFFRSLFTMIKFLVSSAHISFPEFQALIITEIHLNHCKDSPCVFNFSFFSFFLFNGVLHGGSTWWFIKDLIPFSKFSSRFIARELKLSSYCNPECNFFLPYYRRWYYVILDNLSSCFMIHMLLRMRYVKSINQLVGAILCHVSPKAFPKDCCYLWCL